MDITVSLHEIHTLTWTYPVHGLYVNTYPYMDIPVNYMKYIPLHGQPCKLYEIHTLTWTSL